MNFTQKLSHRWAECRFVCVGLDPELERIPSCIGHEKSGIVYRLDTFNRAIIDATHESVSAYKLNTAHYARYGDEGLFSLMNTVLYIRNTYPEIPTILDAKRGDIDTSNVGYVAEAFEQCDADAVTVNPYLGGTPLAPFFQKTERGVIVLTKTSNEGSEEFQDRLVTVTDSEARDWRLRRGTQMPLYQLVAYRVSRVWNRNRNCALVVSGGNSKVLRNIRSIIGTMPILVPGFGAQGADLKNAVRHGMIQRGKQTTRNEIGLIPSVSRAVIYASTGVDFAHASGEYVKSMNALINQYVRT